MTIEELAVLFINVEDDVDEDGRINLKCILGEFDDWLKTSGECKNFIEYYNKYKEKLNE